MDAKDTDACPTAEMLAAFAAGRLGDDDLTRVAVHLDRCPACLKAMASPDPFTQNLQRIHQDSTTSWSGGMPSAPAAKAMDPYFYNVSNDPPTKDPEQFFDALARSGLFDAEDMKVVRREWKSYRSHDLAAFAETLAVQGRLTEFHVRQLLRGKTHGWVLNDYVILHPLSAGGMGWIFRARNRRKNRSVALKITPPHFARSTSAVKRFQREIDIVARLRHPRLVTAIDAGEDEGLNYLVMDEMQGHSLAEYVELNGPMRVLTAVDMIRQATEGIAAAHEAGVIHRDINPSNIWVEVFTGTTKMSASGPGVKVLDFGMAHMTAAESSQRSPGAPGPPPSGTVGYVAPEQTRDSRNADARSDIYSLGCSLYYLLTGKSPYQAKTAAETLAAQEQAPIPPLESPREPIPAALQTIYRRMVPPDPKQRYASADDLIDDLDAFLKGTKISAPLPKWASTTALGAAAAIALVALTWLTISWLRPGTQAADRDGVVKIAGPLPAALDGPAPAETVVERQKAWATALGLPVEFKNSLGMTFRLVPPGAMPLGTPAGQIDDRLAQLDPGGAQQQWLRKHRDFEFREHRVTLTQPYYLGTTEVTVKQFRAFADAAKYQTAAETDGRGGVSYAKNHLRRQSPSLTWRTPGYENPNDDDPVVQVTVADATEFCRWLSERDRRPYSLPTESQWEFACRAGRSERWSWGDDPDAAGEYVSLKADGAYGPNPVASKKANALGLYDMSGNVAEWCADWFDPDYVPPNPARDPKGPANGSVRVLRGGAFLHPVPDGIASASRLDPPDPYQDFVGFRVMFEIKVEKR